MRQCNALAIATSLRLLLIFEPHDLSWKGTLDTSAMPTAPASWAMAFADILPVARPEPRIGGRGWFLIQSLRLHFFWSCGLELCVYSTSRKWSKCLGVLLEVEVCFIRLCSCRSSFASGICRNTV